MDAELTTQAIVRMLEQAPSLAALVFVIVWLRSENQSLRVELYASLRRERSTLREVAKLPDEMISS